jgi:hypothetical protein
MAKNTGKQSFVLYHDIRRPLELLTDEQRGKLFLAILDYSEHGIEPDFEDSTIDIAFAFIRNFIDRDAAAWEESRQRRSAAGSKGGKQTQAMISKAKQSQAMLGDDKQSQANQAVPVPVPVPVPDSVPVPARGKKKKAAPFVPPTLEEVREYCKQRNSPVDPDQFYNYFTADPDRQWIDAKGNQVTSWKQKLLTWEKYDHKPKMAGDDLRESYNMMQGWAANG